MDIVRVCWQQRLGACASTTAVIVLESTLYRSETYPPRLGPALAIVAGLFVITLVLLHRIHAQEWTGLAQFGFAISAVGLVLWLVGATMTAPGSLTVESDSPTRRFLLEVVRGPQAGWGLHCVGLVPIGVAAITNRLSLSTRLLLPIGCLLLLEAPLKYLLGDRAGGLTILGAFGLGWLAVGVLLFLESSDRSSRTKRFIATS